ncbi:YhcN/YlaJ family sporulation lipoprotein [Halalkalibacter okhensis]|uniref:Sporulation protein n=1 Tax=Halalkalibacter okhensis TaxID=333138 RepID=A0A0B0IA52_9BACI|nr:YhcN/YlaJ family sporulation lipoprotein [Halalkalibacter okhensis]KHF38170.1 hypothetical protein LQ50_22955 [Halalkalibacter okhensis]
MKNKMAILTSIVLTISILAACGPNNQAIDEQTNRLGQAYDNEVNRNSNNQILSNTQTENRLTPQHNHHQAQKITHRVEDIQGVDDARVIMFDDNVLIGVKTEGNREEVRNEVHQEVQNSVENMHVHVVVDDHIVHRIYRFEEQLRAGKTFDEIGTNFTDILNDIARGTQQDFQLPR